MLLSCVSCITSRWIRLIQFLLISCFPPNVPLGEQISQSLLCKPRHTVILFLRLPPLCMWSEGKDTPRRRKPRLIYIGESYALEYGCLGHFNKEVFCFIIYDYLLCLASLEPSGKRRGRYQASQGWGIAGSLPIITENQNITLITNSGWRPNRSNPNLKCMKAEANSSSHL